MTTAVRGGRISQNLWSVLADVAGRAPGRIALTDGDTRLTYLDLVEEAGRRAREAGSDDCGRLTVLAVRNRVADVVALLAAVARGCDVLVLDAGSPANERKRLLSVLTGNGGPSRRPDGSDGALSSEQSLLLTTSGVTSLPKIVRRSWPSIIHNVSAFSATAYEEQDVVLCTTPLSHCYGMGVGLLAALCSGATVVLPALGTTPERLTDLAVHEGVTVLQSVPFLYRWYLRTSTRWSGLRLAVSAGEPLDSELRDAWLEQAGVPLSDHYGTTETGIVTLNGGGRRLGVGPPVPGVEVRIDHADEKGRGEVWIRSDHGLGEYVGGPSTAASALDGGWYRSGDLGHLSTDGSLVLTGRRNVRINVAGRKVDPFEVEELILSLPEITECAVIAAPSPVTGEEVVAFVVAEDGFSWPRVRTYLAQHLSAHKIPTRVTRCSGLARTASGKVRRADLLAQLSSDAPTTSEEGK